MSDNKQVVLITGASRGIGLGIAKIYASEGSTLILTEISERYLDLKVVAEELRKEFNVNIKILEIDIRNLSEIKDKISLLKDEYSKITTLINNAGINIIKDSLEVCEDDWNRVSDINLKGTFFMTQQVVKNMIKNDIRGSIINIASQHGVVGNINRAVYCATKAGIINMTRALSYEWAKYGIRVNCVSPTYVETKNNTNYLNSSKGKRDYLNKIPLKIYAKPEDIGNACKFLSSLDSKLITGQNIIIDGGYTSI